MSIKALTTSHASTGYGLPTEILMGIRAGKRVVIVCSQSWVNLLRHSRRHGRQGRRVQLEAILAGPDSPTQLAVATTLGVKRRLLNQHFSELARAISDKHKQAVAILTAAKRASRNKRASTVITKIFDKHRPISRRKIWAALENGGLTFADPETRHTVREVIEEHQHQTCSVSTKMEDC
ncbi:MAG: hypothetical protein WBJ68_02560 [Candidatus Dechloromonas phosphoritropha]|jgi:hypothetical protein